MAQVEHDEQDEQLPCAVYARRRRRRAAQAAGGGGAGTAVGVAVEWRFESAGNRRLAKTAGGRR
eukprot:4966243-Prymnesium_polylepis.1